MVAPAAPCPYSHEVPRPVSPKPPRPGSVAQKRAGRRGDAGRAVGLVLRQLRTDQGLSQEKLGFKAKVTKNYVSDIEGARRNPTVRVLGRLIVALGATWSEFGAAVDQLLHEDR